MWMLRPDVLLKSIDQSLIKCPKTAEKERMSDQYLLVMGENEGIIYCYY